MIERAILLSKGSVLELDDVLGPAAQLPPVPSGRREAERLTLAELEDRHIRAMLAETDWRIAGDRGAAKILGLHPNTLRSRMKKLGIRRAER